MIILQIVINDVLELVQFAFCWCRRWIRLFQGYFSFPFDDTFQEGKDCGRYIRVLQNSFSKFIWVEVVLVMSKTLSSWVTFTSTAQWTNSSVLFTELCKLLSVIVKSSIGLLCCVISLSFMFFWYLKTVIVSRSRRGLRNLGSPIDNRNRFSISSVFVGD